MERTGSSWNFLSGIASFSAGKGRKPRVKDGELVPPHPPLQSIPSTRMVDVDARLQGSPTVRNQPGTPSSRGTQSNAPSRASSMGTLNVDDKVPKTRRHEAQGKSIRWAPGVQSRNGRMAKSDSMGSVGSDRPARSTSLS